MKPDHSHTDRSPSTLRWRRTYHRHSQPHCIGGWENETGREHSWEAKWRNVQRQTELVYMEMVAQCNMMAAREREMLRRAREEEIALNRPTYATESERHRRGSNQHNDTTNDRQRRGEGQGTTNETQSPQRTDPRRNYNESGVRTYRDKPTTPRRQQVAVQVTDWPNLTYNTSHKYPPHRHPTPPTKPHPHLHVPQSTYIQPEQEEQTGHTNWEHTTAPSPTPRHPRAHTNQYTHTNRTDTPPPRPRPTHPHSTLQQREDTTTQVPPTPNRIRGRTPPALNNYPTPYTPHDQKQSETAPPTTQHPIDYQRTTRKNPERDQMTLNRRLHQINQIWSGPIGRETEDTRRTHNTRDRDTAPQTRHSDAVYSTARGSTYPTLHRTQPENTDADTHSTTYRSTYPTLDRTKLRKTDVDTAQGEHQHHAVQAGTGQPRGRPTPGHKDERGTLGPAAPYVIRNHIIPGKRHWPSEDNIQDRPDTPPHPPPQLPTPPLLLQGRREGGTKNRLDTRERSNDTKQDNTPRRTWQDHTHTHRDKTKEELYRNIWRDMEREDLIDQPEKWRGLDRQGINRTGTNTASTPEPIETNRNTTRHVEQNRKTERDLGQPWRHEEQRSNTHPHKQQERPGTNDSAAANANPRASNNPQIGPAIHDGKDTRLTQNSQTQQTPPRAETNPTKTQITREDSGHQDETWTAHKNRIWQAIHAYGQEITRKQWKEYWEKIHTALEIAQRNRTGTRRNNMRTREEETQENPHSTLNIPSNPTLHRKAPGPLTNPAPSHNNPPPRPPPDNRPAERCAKATSQEAAMEGHRHPAAPPTTNPNIRPPQYPPPRQITATRQTQATVETTPQRHTTLKGTEIEKTTPSKHVGIAPQNNTPQPTSKQPEANTRATAALNKTPPPNNQHPEGKTDEIEPNQHGMGPPPTQTIATNKENMIEDQQGNQSTTTKTTPQMEFTTALKLAWLWKTRYAQNTLTEEPFTDRENINYYTNVRAGPPAYLTQEQKETWITEIQKTKERCRKDILTPALAAKAHHWNEVRLNTTAETQHKKEAIRTNFREVWTFWIKKGMRNRDARKIFRTANLYEEFTNTPSPPPASTPNTEEQRNAQRTPPQEDTSQAPPQDKEDEEAIPEQSTQRTQDKGELNTQRRGDTHPTNKEAIERRTKPTPINREDLSPKPQQEKRAAGIPYTHTDTTNATHTTSNPYTHTDTQNNPQAQEEMAAHAHRTERPKQTHNAETHTRPNTNNPQRPDEGHKHKHTPTRSKAGYTKIETKTPTPGTAKQEPTQGDNTTLTPPALTPRGPNKVSAPNRHKTPPALTPRGSYKANAPSRHITPPKNTNPTPITTGTQEEHHPPQPRTPHAQPPQPGTPHAESPPSPPTRHATPKERSHPTPIIAGSPKEHYALRPRTPMTYTQSRHQPTTENINTKKQTTKPQPQQEAQSPTPSQDPSLTQGEIHTPDDDWTFYTPERITITPKTNRTPLTPKKQKVDHHTQQRRTPPQLRPRPGRSQTSATLQSTYARTDQRPTHKGKDKDKTHQQGQKYAALDKAGTNQTQTTTQKKAETTRHTPPTTPKTTHTPATTPTREPHTKRGIPKKSTPAPDSTTKHVIDLTIRQGIPEPGTAHAPIHITQTQETATQHTISSNPGKPQTPERNKDKQDTTRGRANTPQARTAIQPTTLQRLPSDVSLDFSIPDSPTIYAQLESKETGTQPITLQTTPEAPQRAPSGIHPPPLLYIPDILIPDTQTLYAQIQQAQEIEEEIRTIETHPHPTTLGQQTSTTESTPQRQPDTPQNPRAIHLDHQPDTYSTEHRAPNENASDTSRPDTPTAYEGIQSQPTNTETRVDRPPSGQPPPTPPNNDPLKTRQPIHNGAQEDQDTITAPRAQEQRYYISILDTNNNRLRNLWRKYKKEKKKVQGKSNDKNKDKKTHIQAEPDTVFDYTTKGLSIAEKQVLGLGKSFIITQNAIDIDRIKADIATYIRRLRLHYIFRERKADQTQHNLDMNRTHRQIQKDRPPKNTNHIHWRKPKSTFQPDETQRDINQIERNVETNIATQLTHRRNGTPNIPHDWKLAIDTLKNRIAEKEITITQADKGGGIIALDHNTYIHKGTKYIVEEAGAYEEEWLAEDLLVTLIAKDRDKIVKELKDTDTIPLDTATYATHQTIEKITGMKFYYKIHKTTEMKDMPVRPLQSCIGSPTQHLSQVLTDIYKPYIDSKRIPTYLRDTNHTLYELDGTTLRETDTLASADVVALYPSIEHDKGLKAIEDFTRKHMYKDEKKIAALINAFRLVITRNYVKWQGNIYKQTRGVAMGTPVAVTYANIYMDAIDHKLALTCPHITLHRRYIDDNLFIIPKAKKEDFRNTLNNLDPPALKFTVEYLGDSTHEKTLPFLDINFYLGDHNEICTRLYTKNTDKHQYLLPHSQHPRHIIRNIPRGVFARIRRLCTKDTTYWEDSGKAMSWLKERGYKTHILTKIREETGSKCRWQMIKDIEDREGKKTEQTSTDTTTHIPFINTYSEPTKNFTTTLQNQKKTLDDIFKRAKMKTLNAYRRKPNIGDMLIQPALRIPIEGDNPTPKQFTKCNKHLHNRPCPCTGRHSSTLCRLCAHEAQAELQIKTKITRPITCDSKNLIYMIWCDACGIKYIGETQQKLRLRLMQHLHNINTQDQDLYNHFRQPGHRAGHLKIAVLETLQIDEPIYRKIKESTWIGKLKTFAPHGLNAKMRESPLDGIKT